MTECVPCSEFSPLVHALVMAARYVSRGRVANVPSPSSGFFETAKLNGIGPAGLTFQLSSRVCHLLSGDARVCTSQAKQPSQEFTFLCVPRLRACVVRRFDPLLNPSHVLATAQNGQHATFDPDGSCIELVKIPGVGLTVLPVVKASRPLTDAVGSHCDKHLDPDQRTISQSRINIVFVRPRSPGRGIDGRRGAHQNTAEFIAAWGDFDVRPIAGQPQTSRIGYCNANACAHHYNTREHPTKWRAKSFPDHSITSLALSAFCMFLPKRVAGLKGQGPTLRLPFGGP
jgi:hypothetical protein